MVKSAGNTFNHRFFIHKYIIHHSATSVNTFSRIFLQPATAPRTVTRSKDLTINRNQRNALDTILTSILRSNTTDKKTKKNIQEIDTTGDGSRNNVEDNKIIEHKKHPLTKHKIDDKIDCRL